MRLQQISCAACGWSSRPLTPGRAAYALRRHSCVKHRRLAERRARAQERRAAVDRTPKPCLHPQASHQHGTNAAYKLDRCRCQSCTAANSAYEANRARQRAYGRQAYVDAAPARTHVLALMQGGVGLRRLAALSGVPTGAVSRLIYGRSQPDGTVHRSARVRAATAEALMAVQLDEQTHAPGARIDSAGVRRRLRALIALGWSQAKLAKRLGVQPCNFGRMLYHRKTITAGRARAVRALYDELSMQLPPAETHQERIAASRAQNYARARGWLPPLAYDDDQLDTPDDLPTAEMDEGLAAEDVVDEAAILRRMDGDRTVRVQGAEAAEVIRRLRAAGHSDAHIGAVTGLRVDRYAPLRRDLDEASHTGQMDAGQLVERAVS